MTEPTASQAPRDRESRLGKGERIEPPHPTTIDLHTHTNHSDGLLEPVDLLLEAAKCGVRLLAITDHDTLNGYRALDGDPRAEAAMDHGLMVLPSIEINSVPGSIRGLPDDELHVLGIGVDPDDDPFEAFLHRQRGIRARRFGETLDRLRELGLPVDAEFEAVEEGAIAGTHYRAGDSFGRPRVARLLVAAGHVASVEDAFRRLLSPGMPAYLPKDGVGPVEAIRLIRAAGGLPVLAHFAEARAWYALVRELQEAGLGGLEVYYRRFGRDTVAELTEVAEALRLVATGGSDYHGDTATYAEQHAATWVPPSVAEPLHEALVRGSSLS